VLLSFAEDEATNHVSAHMIENRHLYSALLAAAQESPQIQFVTGSAIMGYQLEAGQHSITLANGQCQSASLVVAADGRNSLARTAAGIETVGWDYDQAAIVTTVEHELPHGGLAEEHFRPPGPFAILPLTGNRSSIVWTEARETAHAIMALPDPPFLGELSLRFGTHRGELRLAGPRHSYPLGLRIAKSLTASRLALVGDAAHVVHPIAGLGFNLGLRDVAALAEVVHEAAGLGEDIGSTAVLERYSTWRRFDTVMTAAAMDGLNRLFANDIAPVRAIRDAGISIVDRLPGLKSAFVREASGLAGNLPRLMRGISI
jgi:2-octaprenyl-6-methoxyphenol hydroxylase